jgi:predicted secreted protein with PEFG-CTERM motif
MSTQYAAIALFAILVTGTVMTPALAQEFEDAITITTDKDSYADGETITVTGQVRERLSGYMVSLQVLSANGNLVTIKQLAVSDEDNTFGTDIVAGGPLWAEEGTYTIKVLYGTESRTAETIFEFGGFTGAPPSDEVTFPVTDTDFAVNYSIKGGSLLSIIPSIPDKSLLLEIETTRDGEITITLPRGLIDARSGADGTSGEDVDFFVLVDGAEVDYEETTTADDRTLTIPFEDGATEIEIIGTFVIPEFGTMAAIILAVAIISIIAVSARTRLVLPKY